MPEQIENVEFETEVSQSYVNYAMSVITDRALPDVQDGLKPVQRRVLYTLSSLAKPNTPHRKCARIVGDTMGKYHPHGDNSIYECLVNLTQEWKNPISLINGHGNFGSINGDGAAAMRYTEARMSSYLEEACMKDMKYFKYTLIPNFDGTEKEPIFLPFLVPNILLNCTKGIAVGMATNIPSHNLGEVIDATTLYLRNPDVSLNELLKVLKGPDFATGGIINITTEELYSLYENGHGKFKIRGKVEIKDIGYGRKSICITELPYTMTMDGKNTSKFLSKVAELVRNHEIEGVVEIADRGSSESECLCIDLKKMPDEDIQNIINILYKKAGLEDSYSANFNCINNGKPEVMGLKRILELYTKFKKGLYQTKYKQLLEEQENIIEIKSGLVEAIDVIDLIIEIIRGSSNLSDCKKCLTTGDTSKIKFRYKGSEADAKSLNFTDKQADEILSMKLQKLIGLEIDLLKKELKEAEKLAKEYKQILKDNTLMIEVMIKDMEEIKKKFSNKRKTQIKDCGVVQIRETEYIASDVTVLLDRFYYLKVIEEGTYQKNKEQIDSDYRWKICCKSTDRIGVFASDNHVYMIKVSDIIKQQGKKNSNKKGSVIGKLSDKGIQIFDFCKMNGNEDILHLTCLDKAINENFVFVDNEGCCKIVSGNEFDLSKRNCKTSNGENIIFIGECKESDYLAYKSKKGYYTRISIKDIPKKGKSAKCSKIVKLDNDDVVEFVNLGDIKENLTLKDTVVPFSKIKLQKKGEKAVKMRI